MIKKYIQTKTSDSDMQRNFLESNLLKELPLDVFNHLASYLSYNPNLANLSRTSKSSYYLVSRTDAGTLRNKLELSLGVKAYFTEPLAYFGVASTAGVIVGATSVVGLLAGTIGGILLTGDELIGVCVGGTFGAAIGGMAASGMLSNSVSCVGWMFRLFNSNKENVEKQIQTQEKLKGQLKKPYSVQYTSPGFK